MTNQLIEQAFIDVKEQLDLASNLLAGGFCVLATKLAYERLSELGVKDLRVAGGRAFYSVNKGTNGLIDYGYTENSVVGVFIGYFWVVYKDKWIIDFTLPYLKSAYIKDNQRRGIKDTRFKLECPKVLSMAKLSTLQTLYDGKIGYHYNEIKERGEMVWVDDIPNLKPIF